MKLFFSVSHYKIALNKWRIIIIIVIINIIIIIIIIIIFRLWLDFRYIIH